VSPFEGFLPTLPRIVEHHRVRVERVRVVRTARPLHHRRVLGMVSIGNRREELRIVQGRPETHRGHFSDGFADSMPSCTSTCSQSSPNSYVRRAALCGSSHAATRSPSAVATSRSRQASAGAHDRRTELTPRNADLVSDIDHDYGPSAARAGGKASFRPTHRVWTRLGRKGPW
jgi:hypothetical protein